MPRFPLRIRATVSLALVAIAWLFSSHPLPAQEVGGEVARAFRDANGPRILREYAELLSMPNVASDSAGIWANATFIRDALAERGVEARLLTLPEANPIVYGELRTPGATRTLGLYVHYDGQPADPANWTHDPWDPVLYTRSMEDGGEAQTLSRGRGRSRPRVAHLRPVGRGRQGSHRGHAAGSGGVPGEWSHSNLEPHLLLRRGGRGGIHEPGPVPGGLSGSSSRTSMFGSSSTDPSIRAGGLC